MGDTWRSHVNHGSTANHGHEEVEGYVQSQKLDHMSGVHGHMCAVCIPGYPEASIKAGSVKKHQAMTTETKVTMFEKIERGEKMTNETILKKKVKLMEHVSFMLCIANCVSILVRRKCL